VRRFPAYLLSRLNYDDGSPWRRLIHTPTTPEGVIKDNSVLKMLKHSISDGALYRFRDPATGEGDAEAMLALVKAFWTAVHDTFPNAWGLPARRSRLMHGVGIVSLGFVMDAIADRYWRITIPGAAEFAADLVELKDLCRWTHGHWDFGPHAQRKWNELQNTPKDIQAAHELPAVRVQGPRVESTPRTAQRGLTNYRRPVRRADRGVLDRPCQMRVGRRENQGKPRPATRRDQGHAAPVSAG
jgi:hypothetical protein